MSLRHLAAWGVLAAALLTGCSGGSDDPPKRIVVVTWDTTRADRLGAYGYEHPTSPNLDRFAAESVLFEQAVSPVPTTLPSHSSMFTGLYPQDHGVRYNIVFTLSDEAETLAEKLGEAGYRSAGFPATIVLESKFGLSQGFDHWVDIDPDESKLQPVAHGGERSAADGVDLALAWLEEQGDEPVFLWLHFYDPHGPFTPPFPYSSQFSERPYDGELAYTDAQFGRLLDALREHPSWDDTLVVMAGDHGEGLNDHGESWHSYLIYESTQRVPFIVRAPGHAPRRVAEPVTIADITPTVLDLAGVEAPPDLRGVSLAGALAGAAPPSRFIYFETFAGALNYGWQEIRGVRFANWKLIDSSEPELYDLAQDPDELNNLAAEDPTRVERFRRELESVGTAIREGMSNPADQELTAEEIQRLAALGYVAGGTGGEVAEDARTPQSQIHLESEMTAARLAIREGNWAYLEDLCRYIYGLDPNNKWALTNLTNALLELGRPAEADPFSQALLELYPKNSNSYMTRGRALSEMGKPREAYDLLQEGRTQLPDNEHIGYLSLVAGFDAGTDVCGGELAHVIEQFSSSGRIRMLSARCALRGEGGVLLALVELDAAVQLGYKEIESLREFDEFAPLVADERYEALVERAKSGKTRRVVTFSGEETPATE